MEHCEAVWCNYELQCVEFERSLTAGFDTSNGRYSRPGDANPVRWNIYVTVDSEGLPVVILREVLTAPGACGASICK